MAGAVRRRTCNRVFVLCFLTLESIACAQSSPSTPTRLSPPLIDAVQGLRTEIDSLIEQPGHRRGIWGIVVQSLGRNERLYERNPRTLLIPASAMKLVTVTTAAEAVGWEFTFETALLAAGPVVDGTLQGDLVIVGSGDPSVLGRAGDDSLAAWIDALRQRGISRIEGRVVADDDKVEEPRPGFAWSWEDLGYPYGAIAGALNLGENTLDITVTPGTSEGLPTVIELPPHARDLPVVNRSVTGVAGTVENLWPEFRPGELALSINGAIAAGSAPEVIPVAAGNPTLWFARAVRNRLRLAGIDVAGQALDVDDLPSKPDWSGASVVYRHRSRALSEISVPLLKDSINVYAEAVLRLAGGVDGPRTADRALDAARQRLESWGIPNEGIQIVDGSGLSRRDVVAAQTLVAILQRFFDASGASPLMRALPVAGRDGTLASRMRGTPAEGNATAKTGSLSNVRALAGYVRTADGEPLAFAILANNFEGPASGVTATIDRLVARLASFSRGEGATKSTKAFLPPSTRRSQRSFLSGLCVLCGDPSL